MWQLRWQRGAGPIHMQQWISLPVEEFACNYSELMNRP
ncbi:hypothetical protein COLO4_16021 [Corchorus olitorius]|uniref:Uncharacterized protein n=1 Tax=Corchorus olitorius TaxID=93759 RepID=A0A1R3JK64_9ROSI|nr:hypothetical protein COLO4_16021 [Corchorus olitorius]